MNQFRILIAFTSVNYFISLDVVIDAKFRRRELLLRCLKINLLALRDVTSFVTININFYFVVRRNFKEDNIFFNNNFSSRFMIRLFLAKKFIKKKSKLKFIKKA